MNDSHLPIVLGLVCGFLTVYVVAFVAFGMWLVLHPRGSQVSGCDCPRCLP